MKVLDTSGYRVCDSYIAVEQILIIIRPHSITMIEIKLEIPEDILKIIDVKDPVQLEEIFRMGMKQIKIEKALHSYDEGKISLAKAAELADIPLSEIMMQASARGLKPLYDKKMREEETQ